MIVCGIIDFGLGVSLLGLETVSDLLPVRYLCIYHVDTLRLVCMSSTLTQPSVFPPLRHSLFLISNSGFGIVFT